MPITPEGWRPDPEATFARRPGGSPMELGNTSAPPNCPDLWELSNGDIAVIGHDLTDNYSGTLPDGVYLAPYERLIVIPRSTFKSAAEGAAS